MDVRQKSVRFMRARSLSSVASVGHRELDSASPASTREGEMSAYAATWRQRPHVSDCVLYD